MIPAPDLPGDDKKDEPKVAILIVDDLPANLVSLEAILKDSSYEIVAAASGPEALKYTLQREFAVILLDVMMPGMDGFEVARLVRRRRGRESTPIIFLTAIATDPRYLLEGYEAGAVDYIPKPLVAEIVRSKVSIFVDLFRKGERIKQQAAEMREIQRIEGERRVIEVRRAGERHYRELAEALPQVVWTGSATGEITYINRRWTELTGKEIPSPENPDPWRDAVHPEDFDTFLTTVRGGLDAQKSFTHEVRFRDVSSGKFRWHLMRSEAERDVDGKVVGWFGTLTDIEAQKRAEAEQRFLADASARIAPATDDLVQIEAVAQTAAHHFADYCFIDLALPGRPFRRIAAAAQADDPKLARFAAKTREEAEKSGAAALGTGVPTLTSCEEFSIASAPLILRGETAGAVTFATEGVSQLDQADVDLARETCRHVAIALENAMVREEAVDNNRRKDEFLALLSHELRTPLNAVIGWIELVRSDVVTALPARQDVHDGIEVVERNAKALAQLVEDLLDVSRIITGKVTISHVAVDLNGILAGIAAAARPQAELKGLKLETRLPGRPAVIVGDEDRLSQVIWNLLNNAIKFTPDGGKIELVLSREGGRARIEVRDSGIGIQPELLPFVFERFRQADSSRTRRHAGLGLGLAIVKHMVEAHAGRVYAESRGAGCGSAFVVELPLMEQSYEKLETDDSLATLPTRTSRTPLEGTTVLLVDDDDASRRLSETLLQKGGACVRAAASVREAALMLEDGAPDILITDIAMPGEDGFSMLKRIRAYEKSSGNRVFAAALSAYASAEDAERALSAGFELYLTKPIRANELVTAVSKLMAPELPPI